MKKILFTFALALLFTAVVGQICGGRFSSPREDWVATWTVSNDSLYATFTVMAMTDGWVGIGFSPDRQMPNSDVIIGAASADGRQYFVSDRYTDATRNAPRVDPYQNITYLSAEQITMESGTYTSFTFTRPICSNDANDFALSENPYLLFAWGPVNNFDRTDRNSIRGHMMTDRGASTERFDFTCNATRGSYESNDTGVNFQVSWEVTPDAAYATFTMMAATEGWLAIGFSLDRMMANTDVIVGASDGMDMSYVSDRYATARGVPPDVDAYQDISNANASQMGENQNIYTMVNFTRPTISSDSRDLSLDNENGIYILHAWGTEENFNGSDPTSINSHTVDGGAAASMDTFTFFRCGVILEPDNAPIFSPTPSPTPTAAGAAVSVTTALVLILLLIALMNTLI